MSIRNIKFKIIGNPVAKGRPRFARCGSFVKAYTPINTRKWEEFIRFQAINYKPEALWMGPISMTLAFLMPRPKSLPKKITRHVKKPDVDNLAKSIKDALQGIIYHSDSQIFSLTVAKKYSMTEYGVLVSMDEFEM